jgi:hypothetical protein
LHLHGRAVCESPSRDYGTCCAQRNGPLPGEGARRTEVAGRERQMELPPRRSSEMRAWVAVAAFALGGCATAPRLIPGPGVTTAPGRPEVAQVEERGVELRVEDVRSSELSLPPGVKAVHVRLTNQTDRPLRVRSDDFSLQTPQGLALTALPPYQVARVAGAFVPTFQRDRFFVSPWYSPFYSGFPIWRGSLASPWYYGAYVDPWPAQRVTARVLEESIPEGVLEPGGHVDGLLYFRAPEEGVRELALQMRLLDARDDRGFGELEIPMQLLSPKEARQVLGARR